MLFANPSVWNSIRECLVIIWTFEIVLMFNNKFSIWFWISFTSNDKGSNFEQEVSRKVLCIWACPSIAGYLLVRDTRKGPLFLFLFGFSFFLLSVSPPPQKLHISQRQESLFYSLMYSKYLFIGARLYWASAKCHEVRKEKVPKKELKKKQICREAVENF